MSMTRAELQDAARKAFGDGGLAPSAEASWSLIAEMGWLMMAVPEDKGGLGLGIEATGVIQSELGRVLAPGPVIAQFLAIEALAAADGQDELLAEAMGGTVMTASLAGAATGDMLACVPDADRAERVLVVRPGRLSLVPLAGLAVTPRETWDKSRRLFDVAVPDTADGITIAEGDAADALAERLQALLLFALAGDSIGGADAVLAMTIDYLNTRRQFDRPLALFQALKHRVADMKTWLATAEALFWARATDPAAMVSEMGALKAHATTTYRLIAEDAVQLHGGIGLTMEYPCHLFLKRAFLNAALGGDADRWEEVAGRKLLARLTD